ncbi:MAG: hypothetical protein EOO63_11515 [Hymenobacter sp.]|nr:MAG: hypothetical protein EOO63_11515 [Hymenobacter sp.]
MKATLSLRQGSPRLLSSGRNTALKNGQRSCYGPVGGGMGSQGRIIGGRRARLGRRWQGK